MNEADKMYVKSFKEWLKEQVLVRENCESTINTSKKIIESNEKQIEFNKGITSSAIATFNKWAVANNIECIEEIDKIPEVKRFVINDLTLSINIDFEKFRKQLNEDILNSIRNHTKILTGDRVMELCYE